MKSFSLKPSCEPLDIEVDGQQVYVRQLTAGDKLSLSEMMGSMASIAAQVKANADGSDEESLGETAAAMLSADQYESFMKYQAQVVYLRWCNEKGVRKFTERKKFNDVPAEVVDAIYTELSTLDPSEEEAKGNS